LATKETAPVAILYIRDFFDPVGQLSATKRIVLNIAHAISLAIASFESIESTDQDPLANAERNFSHSSFRFFPQLFEKKRLKVHRHVYRKEESTQIDQGIRTSDTE
jgi:hypothetical protein